MSDKPTNREITANSIKGLYKIIVDGIGKGRYHLFHYFYSIDSFVGYVFDKKTGKIKEYFFKQ